MKSLIYGYGETGKSFERYLINNNQFEFFIYDQNIPKLNNEYDLSSFDQILCSPGIPKNIFEKIKKDNKNVLTDLDIFFNQDNSIKIGITGTNRKSTTAYHLHQLFSKYSSSKLLGNIGNPMLDFINDGKKYSILELSSFQLDKMKSNDLDFGILLNIQSDHIDYHGSFKSYKFAKEKILSAKNTITDEMDPFKLFQWITNKQPERIQLKSLPFRFELMSKKIINDSKSTNFHSLCYAIKKAKKIFNSEYILIICGDPKKENYKEILIDGPKEVFIFGKHSREINRCIKNTNKIIFESLEDLLYHIRQNNINQNVLFSPGYPSGKDFRNFMDRGKYFNSQAKKYLNENF